MAVIDTTGNLDVLRIYSIILSQLESDPGLRQAQASAYNAEESKVEDLTAKVLDRVKIMRVFDVVGVMEAISEISGELEGRTQKLNAGLEDEVAGVSVETEPDRPQRTVIADSEDEEDEEEDEEEMLFDTYETSVAKPKPTSVTQPDPAPGLHQDPELKLPGTADGHPTSKISFVLVDNLAHVLSSLLKKDYVQGAFQS